MNSPKIRAEGIIDIIPRILFLSIIIAIIAKIKACGNNIIAIKAIKKDHIKMVNPSGINNIIEIVPKKYLSNHVSISGVISVL